jgi:hypothetical protein
MYIIPLRSSRQSRQIRCSDRDRVPAFRVIPPINAHLLETAPPPAGA